MGPGVNLPDGPSGRNPIACTHLDNSLYSEDYLVLFNDGTLGTKISDEPTPWQRKLSKSFDGTGYSMLYHSSSQLSNVEFETNSNKTALYVTAMCIFLSVGYFAIYCYFRVYSKLPDIIPLTSQNIFATMLLLPAAIWWLAPKLIDFTSGEIKIYPQNTDPFTFQISSKEARQFDYLLSITFLVFFGMIFSGELVCEFLLLACICYYSLTVWMNNSSKQVILINKNKRLTPRFEIEQFATKIVSLTKDLEDQEKVSSPILDILMDNESVNLEFKASLWTQYIGTTSEYVGQQNKKFLQLEDSVVKTVAAFLNTEGGTLLIGIKDKPRDSPPGQIAIVLGIEPDYQWLKKNRQDTEGFQHELVTIFSNAYTNKIAVSKHIKFSFPVFEGRTICRIDVIPLRQEKGNQCYTNVKVETEYGKKELFFARISDTTRNMSPQTGHGYISDHFEHPYK